MGKPNPWAKHDPEKSLRFTFEHNLFLIGGDRAKLREFMQAFRDLQTQFNVRALEGGSVRIETENRNFLH